MAAEGDVAAKHPVVALDPSMGPRPDGRGRLNIHLKHAHSVQPSMGPRPDGRGRRAWIGVLYPARRPFNGAATGWPRKAGDLPPATACIDPPSMGPRPDGRGRPRARPSSRRGYSNLQWGRDRMAAEGARPRRASLQSSAFNGAATGWPRKAFQRSHPIVRSGFLQWGRDRMAAEGLRLSSGLSLRSLPSMGPRPDGRGRRAFGTICFAGETPSMGPRPDGRGRSVPAPSASSPQFTLQWGRDRMAAEGG